MSFTLKFTEQAEADLHALEDNNRLLKRFKTVRKALGFLETNPRHIGPSFFRHERNPRYPGGRHLESRLLIRLAFR